jgi:hypothetical protein
VQGCLVILTSEFCKGGALKETSVTSFVLQLRVGQGFVVIEQLGMLTEKKTNVSLRCKTEIFNRSLPHLFSFFVFRLCAFLIFLCSFTPYCFFIFVKGGLSPCISVTVATVEKNQSITNDE